MTRLLNAPLRLFSVGGILRKRQIEGELPDNREAYLTVLQISLPALVELVFTTLINTVDMLMVSSLGTYAITSIGITTQPRMLVLTVFLSINVGVTSIVARSKGEGNARNAACCLRQALLLNAVIACGLLALAIWLAPQFLTFAGAEADVLPFATEYFRIVLAGLFFQILGSCITAAQRGCGNTRISLLIAVVSNITNICFNYLLIGGNLGFPRLEVAGAAIATSLGYFSGFVVALASMLRSHDVISSIHYRGFRPDLAMIGRIARVGGNAIIEQLGLRIGFFMFAQIVASQGTDAFATHQICMQVLEFSFTFGEAHSIAATSLVGQSLGQKRKDLAYLFGGIAQRISIVLSCLIFVLFFTAGAFFMSLFTDEPEVITLGISIMKICAFAQFFQIYRVVISGCLRGAGDNRFLAVCSLIGVVILRPVVSYVLVNIYQLGLIGAWYATLFDMAVRAVITAMRYRSGVWVHKKV